MATIGLWMAKAPETAFIVNSRESLGIAGEHVLDLESLTFPAV